MGAGNPKLLSFDPERFEPVTYFADFTYGDPSEDDSQLLEMNLGDFVGNIAAVLGIKERRLDERNNYYPRLSSSFREGAIVLAEGTRAWLITESGAEYHHLPLAIVPSFCFADFEEEDPESAELNWETEFQLFQAEAARIQQAMLDYGPPLRCRAGAWCTAPVTP